MSNNTEKSWLKIYVVVSRKLNRYSSEEKIRIVLRNGHAW